MRDLAGATQDEVRRHNLGSLLRLLHVRGPMSRAELTALTGLNRSTVGALTSELTDGGLVREEAPVGRRGAGRPSIVVGPESEHVYVLALDVGVEHLVAARVGLGGVVLERRELRQTQGDYDVRRTLRRLDRLARAVLSGAPDSAVCVGVGVGVPGVVRHEDGLVRFAPNLGWVDVPFGRLLADQLRTRLPVFVANDADLGVLAEHVRGAAAEAEDVVYLSGEVGVGGGIILGGRPMSGAGGYGGEVGHMIVNPKGRLCRCGARGCWETEVGEAAILEATGLGPGSGILDVVAAVERGDPAAVAGIRRIGEWLGVGVANLVNLFNPEVIVFGGVMRDLLPLVEPAVQESLGTALAAPREQVRLALPALGGLHPPGRGGGGLPAAAGRPAGGAGARRRPAARVSPIHLEAAGARLTVEPGAGGRASSFVVDGLELLGRGGPGSVQWGWYPMAPWPGRLRDNRFAFGGADHRFPATHEGWAIHGTVYAAPWQVEAQSTSSVTLTVGLGPDWPWAGLARLEWALAQDRLTTRLTVESDGAEFPAEVGWHPWFRRRLERGGEAVLDLPADAIVERGADHLPTGRLLEQIPSGPVDDAFRVPTGRVGITWPGALELTCRTDCRWFVVFTELEPALCVEPQTAPPDALNADPWLVRPGRPRTAGATWSWRVP